MNRVLLIICGLWMAMANIEAKTENLPFGWATCSSETAADYHLRGGGDGSRIVLHSNGGDMRAIIEAALRDYSVVVLDGDEGPFMVSSTIYMDDLRDRTIEGVNGAELCTSFAVTERIKQVMDSLGINKMSSNRADGGGGKLRNGQYVGEQREYQTRRTLIEYLNDKKEKYRESGIFKFRRGENLILRGLTFRGPGCIDVGGDDLVTLSACEHVWVDHCVFVDGMDGNMDVIQNSDFVTVSWCDFRYTGRSYIHALSNLTSGNAGLNITWAYCHWGEGCQGRLPWAQAGTQHIFNCWWTGKGATCIQVSKGAKILVEGGYFGKEVGRILSNGGLGAATWRSNVFERLEAPEDFGPAVSVPYQYELMEAERVPSVLGQ